MALGLRFSVAPPGLVLNKWPRYLGLTPQANHLSPLRGLGPAYRENQGFGRFNIHRTLGAMVNSDLGFRISDLPPTQPSPSVETLHDRTLDRSPSFHPDGDPASPGQVKPAPREGRSSRLLQGAQLRVLPKT